MDVQGFDHVGVVDDLEAATAIFVDLGLDREGERPIKGELVDKVVGLDDVRAGLVMRHRTGSILPRVAGGADLGWYVSNNRCLRRIGLQPAIPGAGQAADAP
jgi:hypothetical protein